jgi:predicted nucleic acid-binding protein
MALVLDTGPLLAAVFPADDHHQQCVHLLENCTERLIVPSPVLPEISYFLTKFGEYAAFIELLRNIRAGQLQIEDLIAQDYDRAIELLEQHNYLRIGFVDAAVLAVTERLQEEKLATLDRRHFTMMRPKHTDCLMLLP